VITPRAPLGQQLLGKRLDDEVSLVVAGAAQVQFIIDIA
jgi:transcription elongation GreA/GreB family factor